MAETIASLLVKIGVEVKEFNGKMGNVKKQLSSFGSTMKQHGKAATAVFGTVAAGIGGLFASSVKASKDFEHSMRTVKSVLTETTNATTADIKKLENQVFSLSKKTGVAATDIAKGMGDMAKMGFDAQKILKAMPHVLNATVASGEKFGTVLKVTEGLLSEFNMKAEDTEHVTNVLTMTALKTRANISKMGEAFKFAAPMAYDLGISMEDLAAATGLMINAGVEGGLAGRALRSVFIRLSGANEAATAAMEEFGIQTKDSQGNLLPFTDILQQVAQATENLGNAEKTAALKRMFGTEAVSGMMALLNKGVPAIKELSAEIENSGGVTEKVAGKMANTLEGSLQRLNASFFEAKVKIGNEFAPAINKLADSLNMLVQKFLALDPSTRSLIVNVLSGVAAFAAFFAVIYPVVTAIKMIASAISFVVNIFRMLAPVIRIVMMGIRILGIVMAAAASLTGIIIIAIVALVAAFIYLWNTSEGFRNFFINMWEGIKSFFSGIPGFFSGIWSKVSAAFIGAWNGIKAFFAGIPGFFSRIWTSISDFFIGVWDGIKTFLAGIPAFFLGIWNKIVAGFQWLYDHNYYFEALVDKIVEIWNSLKTFAINLWNSLVDYVVNKWNALKNRATDVFNTIKDVVMSIWNSLKSFILSIWNAITTFLVNKWNALKNKATSIFNAIKAVVMPIWNSIKSFILSIWNTITTFLINKWNALKNKATSIFNAIKGVVTSIWSSISKTIQGWASKAYKWGANFLQMLINGIKSKIGAMINTVKGIGAKITSFLGFHSPTDKGPLASSDQWMPNFMKMLERGIEMGIPKLEMAVGDVAATIAAADTIAGNSSSVVNNINVSSRQNTLDERGLGRMLERMRFLNGGGY